MPSKKAPIASFPGHWAPPTTLLIYSVATPFPPPIMAVPLSPSMARGIRSPDPQGGYNVVAFQPLKDGKASWGHLPCFTDGFAGAAEAARASVERTGHRDERWDLMARFISRTTGTGASGASILSR